MDASLVWRPDVLSVVASHLQPNNVTLLRLVNKATASHFAQHDTIHLCEPVPSWAFTQHWSQPGACRALSRDKRHQLATCIAALSNVVNLEVALAAAGLEPSEDQLDAAAREGYLRTCLWLTEPGRLRKPAYWPCVLYSAARSGEHSICGWCLKHLEQCPDGVRPSTFWHAATNAASEGQVQMMEWLLQQAPEVTEAWGAWGPFSLIRPALGGCDLRTVLGLWERYGPQQQHLSNTWPANSWPDLLWAALRSPKDWRAKAEWVLVQAAELGVPASSGPLGGHASSLYQAAMEPHPGQGPEAMVERLAWLKAQGCRPTPDALTCALGVGSLPGLRWLLSEGVPANGAGLSLGLTCAAADGLLEVLQAVRELVEFKPNTWLLVVTYALEHGRLAVLQWAADCLTPDELGRALAKAAGEAVKSGCVQTITWALDHGATLTEDAWRAAVGSGTEAAVDFLAEGGCPKPIMGEPYQAAIKLRDWRLLPALHRAGVPFGPERTGLYVLCLEEEAPAAVLRWLEAEAGVDPQAAAGAAEAGREAQAKAGNGEGS